MKRKKLISNPFGAGTRVEHSVLLTWITLSQIDRLESARRSIDHGNERDRAPKEVASEAAVPG